jgi:hypothetical protein
MPTTHRIRLLNLGATLTAVLSLGAVIGVAACEPPPPPPPTTVAPRYERCSDPVLNLLPFRCDVRALRERAGDDDVGDRLRGDE